MWRNLVKKTFLCGIFLVGFILIGTACNGQQSSGGEVPTPISTTEVSLTAPPTGTSTPTLIPSPTVTSRPTVTPTQQPAQIENPDPIADNIELIGHFGGSLNVVYVAGHYAYVGVGPKVVILDIADPANPTPISYIVLPDIVNDIQVEDSFVYVADGAGGLRVINVADPANPAEVGFLLTEKNALELTVADPYVYVAAGADGLWKINVTDVTTPTLIGRHNMQAYSINLQGTYAYINNQFNTSVQILDISDFPPRTIDTIMLEHLTADDIAKIAIGKSYASSFNQPRHVKALAHQDILYKVWGNCKYTAYCLGPLRVQDISDTSDPVLIGDFDEFRGGIDLAIQGDYLYLVEAYGGLVILDISDPASPTRVGYYSPGPISVDDVAVYEGITYVAGGFGSHGLWAVDISNQTGPNIVGHVDLPAQSFGMTLDGDYAYIANDYAGLRTVDISDPSHLVEVGVFDDPALTQKMVDNVLISGPYAFVGGHDGLEIVDVSDPKQPLEIAQNEAPTFVYDVEVVDRYAYLAGGWNEFWVMDVVDLISPTVVGVVHTPDVASGVAISGHYAYVASWEGGILIVDITKPTQPVVVATYATAGRAEEVTVVDEKLYVVNKWKEGLQVLDISSPTQPVEIGHYRVPFAGNVRIHDGYIYLAGHSGGLFILRLNQNSTYQ